MLEVVEYLKGECCVGSVVCGRYETVVEELLPGEIPVVTTCAISHANLPNTTRVHDRNDIRGVAEIPRGVADTAVGVTKPQHETQLPECYFFKVPCVFVPLVFDWRPLIDPVERVETMTSFEALIAEHPAAEAFAAPEESCATVVEVTVRAVGCFACGDGLSGCVGGIHVPKVIRPELI